MNRSRPINLPQMGIGDTRDSEAGLKKYQLRG